MNDKNFIFTDWINYWQSKGSLFVKKEESWEFINIDYNKIKSLYTKKEKTNLFFSINWYKFWSKSRKEKNVNKINAFYFDIDFKDNKNSDKEEIKAIVIKNLDLFDFVVESRNWYHFYILLREWQYLVKDKENYIKEWKQKWKELESLFWLKFDENIYDLARISRVPFSYHKKDENKDLFELKLLKWSEIIAPLKERESKINEIRIDYVINKMYEEELTNIFIKNDVIYRDWIESWWLKINENWNYINDFSHSELSWNNFSIVLNSFERKIWKDFIKKLEEENKDYEFIKKAINQDSIRKESLIKTYRFFDKYFWIKNMKEIKKNIIISSKIQETLNKIDISSLELKSFLWLLNYAQWQKNEINYYWKEIKCELSEFWAYNWFNNNITYLKTQLETLWKNEELRFNWIKLLNLKIEKENNKYYLIFTILPNYWKLDKKIKDNLYWTHFISKNILNLKTNWEYFKFLCYVNRKVVCNKNIDEYSINNDKLKEKIWDTNLQRIKNNLKNYNDVLWMLNITTKWKEVIFKKK